MDTKEQGLRILSLRAENIKRISVVEITPGGDLVTIAGKNGNGKTSVLDAIWWTLEGTANIQGMPIRKGKDEASVEISLGNAGGEKLRVTRSFKGGTARPLKIETADGWKPKSPQHMLNDLVGELSFDPMAFLSSDAKKQFEILSGLVAFDVDIDALDKARDDAYAARTVVNRDLQRARGAAESVRLPADPPKERIDTTAILDALANADKVNAGIRSSSMARATVKQNRATAIQRISEAEDQIQRLQVVIDTEKSFAEDAERQMSGWEDLPPLVDSDAVRADLQKAEARNGVFDLCERRAQLDAIAKGLEDEVALLTLAKETAETEKTAALGRATMPIDGLSMNGEVVTFNGIPLDQASGAERLRVSMAIGAALNPKLRVMMVRNGNDLDEDGLSLLATFATENDLQIWMERIVPGDASAIILEDGHVRGQEELVEAQAAAEAAQPVKEGFDPEKYLADQTMLAATNSPAALKTIDEIATATLRPHPEHLARWKSVFLNRQREHTKQR